MRVNLVLIVIFSIFLSSCTKEEKKFVSLVEAIKKSKVEVTNSYEFPLVNVELLTRLKDFSELVSNGAELFEKLLNKSKSRKRIRKYLSQNSDLSLICSTLFIEEDSYLDIDSQCKEGFFDICPISFSKYKENSQRIIANLRELLGEQNFSNTDCINYISEEL